jgi:hypothetical protein
MRIPSSWVVVPVDAVLGVVLGLNVVVLGAAAVVLFRVWRSWTGCFA